MRKELRTRVASLVVVGVVAGATAVGAASAGAAPSITTVIGVDTLYNVIYVVFFP